MTAHPAQNFLQLNLFGTPEIRLGDRVLTLGTAKARALLIYLAATGHVHSRAALIDLLWGEMPEANARRNLTATLTSLRKEVASFLQIEPDRVAFRSDAPHGLDIAEFTARLAQPHPMQDKQLVREAVALVRGEFLAGLEVKDAPGFEEWVYTERERLRERLLLALQTLVDHAVAQGDYASGLDYAHQLLAIDPWREVAHRQLMTLHADNGRRDAALLQYETCRKILAEELGVDPSPETMALHMRLLEADAAPPHNLPAPPNSFVGRTTEIAEITQLLGNASCHLLTVMGPGGTGKTRLAIEVARQFVDSHQGTATSLFADGVYLIPLASLSPTDNTQAGRAGDEPMIIALANAIGIEFHGTTPLRTQLLDALADKAMLLLCDNFEHLIVTGAMGSELGVVTQILQAAPGIKFLVTSRVRLKLQEEWLVEVAGLAYPSDERWLNEPLSTLESYSAVALFVRRAAQLQIGFTLTIQDAPWIVQLCKQLAGLPLALELAAGWLPHLTCAEIVAEIEHGIDFLTSTLANLPERHQSLRAVFEHSWVLLSPEEQRTLSKLAVFVGGFSREAATEVADASRLTIMRLADKSLLQRTDETLSSGRYTMHNLVSRFMAEKLFANPVEASQARHEWCRYFSSKLKALEPDFQNERQTAAYAWMQQEIDNLNAAWEHARDAESFAIAESFVESLGNYYTIHTQYHRGYQFMTEALARLRTDFAKSGGADRAVKIALSKVLSWRTVFTSILREYRQAEEDLQEGVTLAREAASPTHIVMALGWLALIAGRQQKYGRMKELAQEGLAVARAAKLPIFEARMLQHLGSAAHRLGVYAEAEALLSQAFNLYHEHQHYLYIDLTSAFLADIMRKQGKFQRAEELIQTALGAQEKIGSQHRRYELYHHLAEIAQARGNFADAQAYYEQSIAFCQEVNLHIGQTPAQIGLGALARIGGNLTKAKAILMDCLAFSQENDLTEHLGAIHYQLGLVALAEADLQNAQNHFEVSRQAHKENAQREGQALAHCGIAQVALAQKEFALSRTKLIEALAHVPQDAEPVHLAILASLAETLILSGEGEAGLQFLAMIRQRPTAWAETRMVADTIWSTNSAAIPHRSSQYEHDMPSRDMQSHDVPTRLMDQLPRAVRDLL